MKNEVFPSIEELIPEVWEAKLPKTLYEEISQRYEELGDKYLSEETYFERRVNGMMFTDRIVNCREEIVDAVFCLLGQIFKETYEDKEIQEQILGMISMLIEIYSVLKFMEIEGEYTVGVQLR